MCLATVFERSGRSRSLLYAALAKAMAREEYRAEIISNVEDISRVITRNSPYTDLARARRRLFALRAALSINDDLRIRVERIDAYLAQPDDMKRFDERCTDEIHRWGILKSVLEQRESIVVVCPRSRAAGDALGCPTIALDFHKTARPPKRPARKQRAVGVSGNAVPESQINQVLTSGHERFLLTELGDRLNSAKYGRNIANLNPIADELASVIANHPAYANARVIAVVPGSKGVFSDQLGREVAIRASNLYKLSKLFVPITRKSDVNAEPRFELVGESLVTGEDVILVDDVYRTGDTLRAAASFAGGGGASSFRIDCHMYCKCNGTTLW